MEVMSSALEDCRAFRHCFRVRFFSASKDGIEQVYRFFVEALGVQVWDSALAANLRPNPRCTIYVFRLFA